jgi:hypothetical protein
MHLKYKGRNVVIQLPSPWMTNALLAAESLQDGGQEAVWHMICIICYCY